MWIKCCILEQKKHRISIYKSTSGGESRSKSWKYHIAILPPSEKPISFCRVWKNLTDPRVLKTRKKKKHRLRSFRSGSFHAFADDLPGGFFSCLFQLSFELLFAWLHLMPVGQVAPGEGIGKVYFHSDCQNIQIVKHLKLTLQGANIYNIPFSRHLWRWPGGIC